MPRGGGVRPVRFHSNLASRRTQAVLRDAAPARCCRMRRQDQRKTSRRNAKRQRRMSRGERGTTAHRHTGRRRFQVSPDRTARRRSPLEANPSRQPDRSPQRCRRARAAYAQFRNQCRGSARRAAAEARRWPPDPADRAGVRGARGFQAIGGRAVRLQRIETASCFVDRSHRPHPQFRLTMAVALCRSAAATASASFAFSVSDKRP